MVYIHVCEQVHCTQKWGWPVGVLTACCLCCLAGTEENRRCQWQGGQRLRAERGCQGIGQSQARNQEAQVSGCWRRMKTSSKRQQQVVRHEAATTPADLSASFHLLQSWMSDISCHSFREVAHKRIHYYHHTSFWQQRFVCAVFFWKFFWTLWCFLSSGACVSDSMLKSYYVLLADHGT